jgi:mannosyltransferase OCH1-like enzyme
MNFPPYHSLSNIFLSVETCMEYLNKKNILHKSVKCPTHKKNMSKSSKFWRCTKRDCSKKYSLLHESFFNESNIEPHKIMLVLYLKLAECPSTTIQKITGHSSKTISSILKKYRELLAYNISYSTEMIGGDGVEVEIDETLISRRTNPWTDKNGVWVFGGVERTSTRKIFAVMVSDRKAKTLLDIIQKCIHPGSIIISDCWSAYKSIPKKLKMDHMTVDHSKNFKDPDSGAHTNHIEGTWHGLKEKIPNNERIPEKIDNYIFEFMWKRQNQNNLWEALLECLANTSYQ